MTRVSPVELVNRGFDLDVPVFALDDVKGLADLLIRHFKLKNNLRTEARD